MRFSKKSFTLVLLCLVLLTACGGDNPLAGKGTGAPDDHCAPVGKIVVGQDRAHLPSADGDWTMFRGDPQHIARAVGSASTLKPAWSYCTGAAVFSSPVVHNGVIYIASTDTTVTALSIQQPRVLWRFRADSPIYSTPAISNDILYIGSLNGTFYALNIHSGRVSWQKRIETNGARIWSSPVVAMGVVIFGVASTLQEQPKVPGQVFALDASTGQERWHIYTEAHAAPGSGIWSSPAVNASQQAVYVGTGDPDDGVQAFHLQDGRLLWHWRSVKKDVGDTDVGAGPLLFTNAQGAEYVVVGGKDGNLYSLDASTRKVLWQKRIGAQIYSSPVYAQSVLYAIGVDGKSATCWALDAETGQARWQFHIPVMGYSSPVIAGQTLYVPTGNGFGPGAGGIYTLNAVNGQVLQYNDLHNTASSSPAVLASWLFLGMNNGKLEAFTRDGG